MRGVSREVRHTGILSVKTGHTTFLATQLPNIWNRKKLLGTATPSEDFRVVGLLRTYVSMTMLPVPT